MNALVQRVASATGKSAMHYRVWSPPGSPVRIEYAPALLQEVRAAGSEGILYGTAGRASIRLATARTPAPVRCDYHAVGIYSVRKRGEVFLTEEDLDAFDCAKAAVALVVAGPRAGFFIREHDGSIQAIRSREEIFLPASGRRPGWFRWLTAPGRIEQTSLSTMERAD